MSAAAAQKAHKLLLLRDECAAWAMWHAPSCLQAKSKPQSLCPSCRMFAYTGLTKEQVQLLTDKYHIYMTFDGRISMAGLSAKTCPYLAKAMKDAVENVHA